MRNPGFTSSVHPGGNFFERFEPPNSGKHEDDLKEIS
jgi:hypothetical protein